MLRQRGSFDKQKVSVFLAFRLLDGVIREKEGPGRSRAPADESLERKKDRDVRAVPVHACVFGAQGRMRRAWAQPVIFRVFFSDQRGNAKFDLLKNGDGCRKGQSGCGSVWLERSVRDAEAARSNRAIPTIFIPARSFSFLPYISSSFFFIPLFLFHPSPFLQFLPFFADTQLSRCVRRKALSRPIRPELPCLVRPGWNGRTGCPPCSVR